MKKVRSEINGKANFNGYLYRLIYCIRLQARKESSTLDQHDKKYILMDRNKKVLIIFFFRSVCAVGCGHPSKKIARGDIEDITNIIAK